MDNKKVDFLLTPRIGLDSESRYRSRNASSTPHLKNSRMLPFSEIKFEDSMTTNSFANITVANLTNRDKSTLYPQTNEEANVRLAREFELLSLKFKTNKCTRLIDESSKQVENEIKKSVNLLKRKQNHLVKISEEVERKKLLAYLRENTDLIVQSLNDTFSAIHLNKIDDQLRRYREIIVPYLASFEIAGIKNANQIDELFKMLKTPEFAFFLQKSNEIKQRQKIIDSEKAERNKHIYRLNNLAKQQIDLVDMIKCLDRKQLLK